MEAFSYITNFVSGIKTAKMSIDRPIDKDREEGITSYDFSRELEYLVNEGVTDLTIDINSIGGSVVEGFGIFAAIKDSPINITTRVVGIAASMAGIISQAGDKRVIMDYGLFHAHGPQVPEGKIVEATLVNKMLESLKIMISSKSNLSEDKITEIMSKESVFTATEALELGFFDEIENSRGEIPIFNKEANITDLYSIANQFINKKDKPMKNLNELLGLTNATEDVIVNKVKEIQAEAAKLEELTNSLDASKNELEALKVEIEKSKSLNADVIVNAAIKDGKITEESKDKWIEQAKNNFDNTRDLLDGLTTVKVASKITNVITPEKKDSKENWDFAKWGQEDPKGLEAMKNTAPEKFQKLYDEYTK